MNPKKINHRQSDYLLFQGLTTYLPAWEVVEKQDLDSGSRMLISHDHIKNGARVCSTISTLENFSFRIPFHRESYALLELRMEGLLWGRRMVNVQNFPVLIQDAYTPLPPLDTVSTQTRMEWLHSLAKTFDQLHRTNFSLRRVSLKDVVYSPQQKVVFRTLGWLAAYFPSEQWRSNLEEAWKGKEKRMDLISFLGIMSELFGFSLPKKEMSLQETTAFMLGVRVPKSIQSASEIAELVLNVSDLNKKVFHKTLATETIEDWSIDVLSIYHEQLSMVCVPEGCFEDRQSATVITQQTWISQEPISTRLFALVLNQPHKEEQNPKTNVSWWEAVRFCNALSKRFSKRPYYRFTGAGLVDVDVRANGFRLPYAIEWKFALYSGRTRLRKGCASEWMQDRFCTLESRRVPKQIHDIAALESISSRWYKRLVGSEKVEQEPKEPQMCSVSLGFRVVLHSPLEKD
jgi:hypothetical protein